MHGKLSLGLLAVTWAALGAALLGVLYTPSSYCNELGTPAGQLVLGVGLAVATGALVVGSFIETVRESSLRRYLVAAGIGAVTVAVGYGVTVLEAHRVAGWGCG